MIGLGSRSVAPTDYSEIEYAASCCAGLLEVYESGIEKLCSCPYSGTSTVELRVTETQVEFLLDGVLKHTSQLRGQQRLHTMASFYEVGAKAREIQWL